MRRTNPEHLVLAVLCLVACTTTASGVNPTESPWDWSRTRTWMEFSEYAPITPSQAKFAATHYDIIGLGGTFGSGPNSGEVAQAAVAKQLKEYNSKVVVLIYRNTEVVINGQLQSDLEFMAHPEWMLRNASGAPVYNAPDQPFINFTNPAAREWWVSSCISAITQQLNGSAIDGVWADGAGDFEVLSRGLAYGQNTLLNASHALAVKELTERLHAIRPSMVTIGNGAVVPSCGRVDDGSKYGKMNWNPCARNLPFLDGVCAEHFGSFESVNGTTGNYDTDGGAAEAHHGGNVNEKWLTGMDIVNRYDGGSKIIIVKSWPGPFGMYPVNGVNEFTWKNLSDANISLTNTMRKTLGARALPWALAAYLLSASENSYMSYGWWYQLSTGYVPCPDEPTSCACPDEWYPDLLKPTGAPLGRRKLLAGAGSGHVWTRQFEKVSVAVDLANFTYPVTLDWKQVVL